jgi:hypothetical protein
VCAVRFQQPALGVVVPRPGLAQQWFMFCKHGLVRATFLLASLTYSHATRAESAMIFRRCLMAPGAGGHRRRPGRVITANDPNYSSISRVFPSNYCLAAWLYNKRAEWRRFC